MISAFIYKSGYKNKRKMYSGDLFSTILTFFIKIIPYYFNDYH